MRHPIDYSRAERLCLAALGLLGLFAGNGAFIYALVSRPGALGDALVNPIAAAVIAESLVLVGLFAYLFRRWGVSRIGWGWFVVLSLLGTMLFAIAVALLFPRRPREPAAALRAPQPAAAAENPGDARRSPMVGASPCPRSPR